MKTILLKSLTLHNFKAAQKLHVDFRPDHTYIHGANGTGKSTVADAFSWLLYGKNSLSVTDFDIKPCTPDGKQVHNLVTSVEGAIECDGQPVVLTRHLSEEWVTKRGTSEPYLKGNKTDYFINDVPVSQKDYQQRVHELIDEEVAKLITSTSYFNEKLNWKERRQILARMAGEVSDVEVLDGMATVQNKDLISIVTNYLNSDRLLADYKKELAAKRSRLKDEAEKIPVRIEEAQRSSPVVQDWSAIEGEVLVNEKELEAVNKQIEDVSATYATQYESVAEARNKKAALEQQLQDETTRLKLSGGSELADKKVELAGLESEIRTHEQILSRNSSDVVGYDAEINRLKQETTELREKWAAENARVFEMDPSSLACPTCGGDIDPLAAEAKKAEMLERFNKDVESNVVQIRQTGKAKDDRLKEMEALLVGIVSQNEEAEAKLTHFRNLRDIVADAITYLEQKGAPEKSDLQISLEAQIAEVKVPVIEAINNDTLKIQKGDLENKIAELKERLQDKRTIEVVEARVAELKGQHKTLAQEIADCERSEMAIDAFTKAKMNQVERRVNSLFGKTNRPYKLQVRMFEAQLNGGEAEDCTILLDGVPYASANTAKQINAGLEIVEAVQNFYGIKATVFVDKRESVTELFPIGCQLVSLIVDPKYKQLEVNPK